MKSALILVQVEPAVTSSATFVAPVCLVAVAVAEPAPALSLTVSTVPDLPALEQPAVLVVVAAAAAAFASAGHVLPHLDSLAKDP